MEVGQVVAKEVNYTVGKIRSGWWTNTGLAFLCLFGSWRPWKPPPLKFGLITEGSWSLVDAEGNLQIELSCTLAILWVGCIWGRIGSSPERGIHTRISPKSGRLMERSPRGTTRLYSTGLVGYEQLAEVEAKRPGELLGNLSWPPRRETCGYW